MKLRQMEVFHAIMSAGTVTGAGDLLNISQPAVTNLLRYTEDQLNIKLFSRVKGRLHPTAEAHILFRDIERVFEGVRSVRRLAVDLRETRRGTLNIVTTPSLGVVALPAAIAAFTRDRPEVRIRLQVRPRSEAIAAIANGNADIGFSFLSVSHPMVAVEELYRGNLICVMPRDHPLAELDEITPRDMARHRMITYGHSQGLNTMIETAFLQQRVAESALIEVSLVSTAWALVANNAGVAIVDSFSGLDKLYPNVAMRRFRPAQEVNFEMLTREEAPMSQIGKEFAKFLRHFIVEHFHPEPGILLK